MSKKRNHSKFTKTQFMQSKQRSGWEKDILAAVLDDQNSYTAAEADKAIQNYLKRGVE